MGKEQFIEELLSGWFDGTLTDEELQKVEQWKDASKENATAFAEFEEVWLQTERLRVMQKYNAQQALNKVHGKIKGTTKLKFLETFKRVAAVFVLPLLVASIYLMLHKPNPTSAETNWYTLHTGAGMRSEFVLPDGTNVFLNSNTTLKYPLAFNGLSREVEIHGEAYFDVAENKKQPFIVNTGNVNVEVTGTEFNVSNYENEEMTEIVLVEGTVRLFQGSFSGKREIFKALVPGEKATYMDGEKKLYYERVDVEKYIAWKDGRLMFRDDSMEEVVRRLNRWYNVDIKLTGIDLGDYAYTATFEDESLVQILDLLKISAPIDYKINYRKQQDDKTFSKMEIEIIQR